MLIGFPKMPITHCLITLKILFELISFKVTFPFSYFVETVSKCAFLYTANNAHCMPVNASGNLM